MIIETVRNHVAALEPLPGDSFVMTRIGKVRVIQSITQYDAAIRDAMKLADHMEAHVDVVPIGVEDFVKLKTGMTMEQFVRALPDSVLEELRQDCIDGCADAVRYCDDPAVRAQAAAVLVKLGVVC